MTTIMRALKSNAKIGVHFLHLLKFNFFSVQFKKKKLVAIHVEI